MARKSTNYIIIHCAATRPGQDIDIKDVDRWHREKGWRMVGYHFFIKRDGTVQTGRALMDGGAHASGYNEKSIGICLAGGLCDGLACDHEMVTFASGQRGKPEANYTPEQWASLRKLTLDMHKQFPEAQVIGHQDIANKACPCFNVKEWWKELLFQQTPQDDPPWYEKHLPTIP